MTNIDFYILAESTLAARDHFACRLTEKALKMGRQVVIQVIDNHHAESLSQYLWSFAPESFVPHSFSGQPCQNANVIIDWKDDTQPYHDVLINLKNEIPNGFSRFQKLSEIVVQEDALLSVTRSHFQFYRDRGYPLASHNIR